ncbi:MAG: Tar ligand binding domain-containing protein [Burkholderiaceae bacterium]|nr:Tar ligand binding domain-containing protein [Burkholderiaceae bacterium]
MKNLTIRTRLTLAMCLLSLLLLGMGGMGIYSLGKSNAALKTVYEDRLVATAQLSTVTENLLRNQVRLAKVIGGTPEQIAEDLKKGRANIETADKEWDAYMDTYLTPEEKILADSFTAARKAYYEQGLNPLMVAIGAQDGAKAEALFKVDMNTLFPPVRDALKKLMEYQVSVGKTEYEQAQSRYVVFQALAIAALIAGILAALGMGVWLIRSISVPLAQAVRIANAVAEGDLTQQIEVRSNDETGQLTSALKNMNARLLEIVSQVRSGTDTIATASAEIAAGNLDLSARTEQQAGSLEETASSMEELTSTVKQNGESARQANQLALSASAVATQGGAVVEQVIETMGAINDSSRKIVDIISVIDGIAFQTNILALNAAVEAARAGEQGRGFAVVASEVRSLAQRSSAAAKEIKVLIDNSVDKVEQGSSLVNQAGATMTEIVSSVRRVTDIMSEITVAGHEQEAGIGQVNQAITQMDAATQQNAALVEQAAAAAASLQDQAGNLEQLVSVFKLTDQRTATTSIASTAPAVRHAPVRAALAMADD